MHIEPLLTAKNFISRTSPQLLKDCTKPYLPEMQQKQKLKFPGKAST